MSLVATFDVEQGTGDPPPQRNQPQAKGQQPRRRPLRHSIYIGGKADARDYDKLVNRWKVTHVLNMTPPKETNIEAGVPNYFQKGGKAATKQHPKSLVYKRIPIYDAPTAVAELSSSYGEEIVGFLSRALCHGSVLVHCSKGISRSATAVALYLMAERGHRYAEALATIRRRRPAAQPIPALEGWLLERDAHYHAQREEAAGRKRAAALASGPGPQRRKTGAAPAIGPALPPRVAAAAAAPIGPSLPAIGPAPPPKAAAAAAPIGPSLPDEAAIGPKPPPANRTTGIGPELPP